MNKKEYKKINSYLRWMHRHEIPIELSGNYSCFWQAPEGPEHTKIVLLRSGRVVEVPVL